MGDLAQRLGARFDIARMDADGSHIAVVNEAGVIVWVNLAWSSFGAANGADPKAIAPGASYVAAIEGELHEWFTMVAAGCMTTRRPFEIDYECSSPTHRRVFRMRMLPVVGLGLLVSHQLRVEQPHDTEGPDEVLLESYRNDDGFIMVCSNCRRVRRADRSAWDWIPQLVGQPPEQVSHGLCSLCRSYYWGRIVEGQVRREELDRTG